MQVCDVVVQSVPPVANPEPSKLQVVATLPLHAGALGLHSKALQVGVVVLASQNWADEHVCDSDVVSPVEPQSMIRLGAEATSQKYVFGAQSWDSQVPVLGLQSFPEEPAGQSTPPVTQPEPSALQVVATLPLQPGWFGVQTRALQVAVALSQYWEDEQVE